MYAGVAIVTKDQGIEREHVPKVGERIYVGVGGRGFIGELVARVPYDGSTRQQRNAMKRLGVVIPGADTAST